jgi:hypothetical protein
MFPFMATEQKNKIKKVETYILCGFPCRETRHMQRTSSFSVNTLSRTMSMAGAPAEQAPLTVKTKIITAPIDIPKNPPCDEVVVAVSADTDEEWSE